MGDKSTPTSERRPERFYSCSYLTWVLPSFPMVTLGGAALSLSVGTYSRDHAASRRVIRDLCLAMQ